MNTESFNWAFDVNTFKLIGSELISDKFTAMVELVKNSYDANATEVKINFIDSHDSLRGKIILADNGIGMNKNDIQTKWMRIGTNSKRKISHSPEPFKRVLLGEKGIGRFAIEKIASSVKLESKTSNSRSVHVLEIDWSEYEKMNTDDNPPLLTSIPNKYYEQDNYSEEAQTKNHGTELIFSNLKETWTTTDIARLKRELAKLVSPIQEFESDFKIHVKETNESGALFDVSDYEEIRNSSMDYASNIYRIGFDSINKKQEELHFSEDAKEMEIIDGEYRSFGPIRMHIYHFNKNDKKKFRLAYKGKDVAIDGFKIYRDGVLATPFVEIAAAEEGVDKYRDILGIDKRRWSNFFGKISSHDFIGIIEISKQDNPGVKDLTNRQDFEDTQEYKDFKLFIVNQLQQIEKLIEKEKKDERETKEDLLEEALKEVSTVKEKIESLAGMTPSIKETVQPVFEILKKVSEGIKKSSAEFRDLKEDLQRQEDVYFSLMSLQEYAADIAHMVRNSLDKVILAAEYLQDMLFETELEEEACLMYSEMKKLRDDVEYMLKYAESSDALKEFDIAELILKAFSAHSKKFIAANINIEISKPETFIIRHNETLLRDVFNNLIGNSIRALTHNNKNVVPNTIYLVKRIIKCSAYKEEDKYIIIFSDNGSGIKDEIKNKIFDRYFTTSKEIGGSGLGLYIVKNNLKTFKGEIELIESEFIDRGCTFKITIPIKGAE